MPSTTNAVHIERAHLYPYPDLTKLWLRVDLSAFTDPPNLEVIVRDPQGEIVSSMFLVEWQEPKVSLTMHLRRPPQPRKQYTAEVILTGQEETPLDRKEIAFDLVFVEPDHIGH